MQDECKCGGDCYRCPDCEQPECECRCYDHLDDMEGMDFSDFDQNDSEDDWK